MVIEAGLARRADERDHLMLQILLLTEKKITAVVGMNRQIASKLGLTDVAKDKEREELGQRTSIDEVAQTIRKLFVTLLISLTESWRRYSRIENNRGLPQTGTV